VYIGLRVILIRPVLSNFEVDFINAGEAKENLFALLILGYCVSLRSRPGLKMETASEGQFCAHSGPLCLCLNVIISV